jgi:hypothetical protein
MPIFRLYREALITFRRLRQRVESDANMGTRLIRAKTANRDEA